MLVALIDPWISVIKDIDPNVFLLVGLVSGIIGLVFSFWKD